MADLYHDRWITCTEDALVIRWYYLWGTKRIPYTAIRSVRRVDMKHLRGKGRIWGTANLGYWASLDPGRPGKDAALILDLGNAVSPYITGCCSGAGYLRSDLKLARISSVTAAVVRDRGVAGAGQGTA